MVSHIALVGARAGTGTARRYLNGPWLDFLTLGGGSFIVLAAVAAFVPRDSASRAALAATMLFLAHFVNHPHFAHSYQVFYRGFLRKAFGESVVAPRYRFAGIMIPVMLAVFFSVALAEGNVALLGLAANAMFFTVGWHYAKQGYGILILDSVRNGVRFDIRERRWLLWNTHLAWFTWWLVANDMLRTKTRWGIEYYMLEVPDALLIPMVSLVAVSTGVVGWRIVARCRTGDSLPVNGLVAYVAAVYVWLPAGRLDPLLLFVVPFFHSLQYMAVVWRYRLNEETGRSDPGEEVRWKAWFRGAPFAMVRFAIAGGVLGAAGFWWVPMAANDLNVYDRAVFGTAVFLFIAWTFINIHHYFIDNVIWRRDNPEMRRHLFGARA